MTPLAAAKALASKGFTPWPNEVIDDDDDSMSCEMCGNDVEIMLPPEQTWFGHKPDCPWLAMPQIVAALEAATLMADRMSRSRYCNGCGREGDDLNAADRHGPSCERWALISAVRVGTPAPTPRPYEVEAR